MWLLLLLVVPVGLGGWLVALVAFPLVALVRLGVPIGKWAIVLVSSGLALILPVFLIWQDRLRFDDCVAHLGQDSLQCGGELGGLMLDMARYGLGAGIVLIGPFIIIQMYRWAVRGSQAGVDK